MMDGCNELCNTLASLIHALGLVSMVWMAIDAISRWRDRRFPWR
jgi:hypothetical protein